MKKHCIKIILTLLGFLLACVIVSKAQSKEEIWEIRTKNYESDTIFAKNGEVKKVYETTSYEWSPIILTDTVQSSTERMNKYAGFIFIENQTIAQLAKKYELPTGREVAAMLNSNHMEEVLEKTDLVIFLSNFAKDNEAWTHKETTIQTKLPKNSFIQDNYQKYTDPRNGYTRIIEKTLKLYDSCMMQLYNKKGVLIHGYMDSQTEISGWIFLTSPKEIY